MKNMKHIVPAITVATVLTFGAWTSLSAEEEEEEALSASSVPAAVQQAAQAEAKGGTIVRWEKEGNNYEAVVEKSGKQTGIELTADGKVVSRHDEAKEHKEKGEKGEKY
jgi:plastocyanin